MKTIYRDIVSALIFSKDGKLLMGRKNPKGGGVYVDCWHIPGGGASEGEEKIDTLKREVLEEVGIDISPYKIILIDDRGKGESEKTLKDTGEKVICKMKFIVYRLNIENKNADEISLKLKDDLVKFEWIKPQDLINYKLTPPSVSLFKKLGYLK